MVLVFHIQRRFWEGNKVFFQKKKELRKKMVERRKLSSQKIIAQKNAVFYFPYFCCWLIAILYELNHFLQYQLQSQKTI